MGAGDIPLDKAELLAVILESLLYGFSLFMFGVTMWVLSTPNRAAVGVKYKMFAAACLLLLFSTAHLVIDVIRVMEGFTRLRYAEPGARVRYFSEVAHWTFVSKNYLYAAQTVLGDGVVLFRCYAVWQHKPVMILPVLLWCAVAVTSFACPFVEKRMTEDDVFERPLSPWVIGFWASTLSTNVVATLLLAYRIWGVDRRASKMVDNHKSELRPILHVVVDAGGIYSVTLLVALICFANRSNGQYVILDMIMPIISITFYMVIIRVGLANRANRALHERCSSGRGCTSSFVVERRGVVPIAAILTVGNLKVDDDDGLCSSVSPATPTSGGSDGRLCAVVGLDEDEDVESEV